MDSQRLHLRSTVVVDQSLLDPPELPPVDPLFELEVPAGAEARIVANTLVVAGGTTRGYTLTLVGETVTGAGPGALSVELVNQTAPRAFTGRPGLGLRVVASRLVGGAGQSLGQRGSKGPKGRDGVEMPPVEQPPQEPPFVFPPFIQTRDGEDGGKGLRGGDGGPVELVLENPSPVTGSWPGKGGRGGEGGDPGKGEPRPNKNSLPGDDGKPGPEGDRGSDVPATVRVVDVDTWRQAVSQARVLREWERLREALAIEEFRRENRSVTLAELAAAERLAADDFPLTDPLAPHLRSLLRDNRGVTGVARDQELVPDVRHHAKAHADRAADLVDALPAEGPLSGVSVDRLAALKTALGGVLEDGSDLTVFENELRGQAAAALTLLDELAGRTARTRARLDAVLDPEDGPAADPGVTAAGLSLTARAVAASLAEVLGAQDSAVVPPPPPGTDIWPPDPATPFPFTTAQDPATLLPLDLDLLVGRDLRERGETLDADAVGALRAGAAGLARLGDWGRVATGQPGGDGQPVVVDLARVARELRAASGDATVLDLLVELAEVSHVWRLARARLEQLLAGRATLEIHCARITAVRDKPVFVDSLVGPADLLPAVRCLLDVLQWYADRADRASALLTLADPKPPAVTRYPFPPALGTDPAAATVALHSPDWERDLAEQSRTSLPVETFNSVITAVRTRNTAAPYDAYLAERGTPIVGEAPAPVTRTFTDQDRPDVLARFASTGQFWFDVRPEHVTGPAGTIPHAETRVVGLRVTFEFDQVGPGVDVPLLVTHTGLSGQRVLGSEDEHRQTLLPATVELAAVQVTDQLYCGQTAVTPPPPPGEEPAPDAPPPVRAINFPVYGRGVAAGWLVSRQETLTVLPPLKAISVDVLYECLVPAGTASLRSVSFAAGGLRAGSEAVLRIALTAPAPPGGAKVALSSSDPAAIALPAAVIVPEGKAEVTALAKVLRATGGLPPTLTAATPDGVTRRARAVVPEPARPLVGSVRLAPPEDRAHVSAVAVAPRAGGGPGTVLAPVTSADPTSGVPIPPHALHVRTADLASRASVDLGRPARAIAVDPARSRIYLGGGDPGTVVMLDAATRAELASAVVGPLVDVVVDSGAGLVYASVHGGDALAVLSADDLSPVTKVTDAAGRLRRPQGLAVVAGPGKDATIYVARTVRGVPGVPEVSALTSVRRTAGGEHVVVASHDFGNAAVQPVDVAVDPVHRLILVSCLGGGPMPSHLVVLDHPTMTERGRVRLFSPGRAVAARPGSGLAYVAGEAGLTVVDARHLTVSTRVQLGDAHLDAGLPLCVAVDEVTGTAYLGTRDQGTLFRVDAPISAQQVFW